MRFHDVQKIAVIEIFFATNWLRKQMRQNELSNFLILFQQDNSLSCPLIQKSLDNMPTELNQT
jgi:hypothetical protein